MGQLASPFFARFELARSFPALKKELVLKIDMTSIVLQQHWIIELKLELSIDNTAANVIPTKLGLTQRLLREDVGQELDN